MGRLFILAALIIGKSAFASSLVMVICSIPYPGGGYQAQADAYSASCDVESGYPLAGQFAIASGAWNDSGWSGYAGTCCDSDVVASSVSTFTETFTVPTLVTFTADLIGQWAQVYGSFNCESTDSNNECYDVETLPPGTYSFGLTVYDSEEGVASAALSFAGETPEPATLVLVVAAVPLLLFGTRRAGRIR